MPNPVTHHPALQQLQAQLLESLQGDCDFSSAGVALYTSDASNYRQVPLGVVFPRGSEDIRITTSLCREHQLPVLMRGGGTSQNGQCVNQAIVLDCSRYMNRVLHIDPATRQALVEPGIVCDSLKASAEQHGLTFGPDPATHSRCTLGGMIGNNSCGPHSMLAGKTVENVIELEVLTAAGDQFWVGPTSDEQLATVLARGDNQARIYADLLAIRDEYADEIRARYPTIKRRVSGYNLDQLLPENGFNVARALVGSEGTCVSILQARVNLIENPVFKQLIVLGFDDIYQAGDSVPDIMPFKPIAMEGLDWNIIGGLNARNLRQREVALLPEGHAWLLVELAGADSAALERLSQDFEQAMQQSPRVRSVYRVTDAQEVTDIWSIREQGASATSMSLDPTIPDPVVGWEDTAVDPYRLGDYLREFQALVDRYGYTTSLYGHFGDGCIHARITFDTRSEEGVTQWRSFSNEIAHLVVRFGGSLSGEHGDGQAKAEFLPIMFGERMMEAFRRFKSVWDPQRRMNPGKLIDAYKMDENLRFGPAYTRKAVATTLRFHEDPGGFSRSTERCIGMGKCRAHSGAMCPSYQATGEEKYSTRGRAHLLHEMLRGEVITDSWNNPDIANSLEHCLSCKACKHECPTQVDIASYKAEFMEAHYKEKRRPLHHHILGHIGTILPILARFPRLVNALQSSSLGDAGKLMLGISVEKELPALSQISFKEWVAQNASAKDEHFSWFGQEGKTPVVLWTDSVNAHYRSDVLISAVRVLQKCDFRVGIARAHFCCGRPLYEYGFLDHARAQLQKTMEGFQPHLPAEACIVVLEPSCLSVFKDELLRLFPDSDRARDLHSRTMTLAKFLEQKKVVIRRSLPQGILHRHCHDKASGDDHERNWMRKCFVNIKEPEAGCCGMAGTFGMRKQTRHIGRTLFNRQLKPAISAMSPDTVIVANGFSCHEQIRDYANVAVLHPVQVIERCL